MLAGESKEIKEQILLKANSVEEMIKHPGWKDVIAPDLERLEKQFNAQLIDENDTAKMKELQSRIRGIVWLKKYIEVILAQGKEAKELLKKGG